MLLSLFLCAQALCSFEEKVYQKISKDLYCRPAGYCMQGASIIGHPGIGLLSPICFHFAGKDEVVLHEFFGFIGNTVTIIPLKYYVNRKRPEEERPRWDSSFPSGHSAYLFTHAYVLSHHYPSVRIPLFAFATTVGFARVYLGKHYPTDVLCGVAVGLLTGWLSVKLIHSSE